MPAVLHVAASTEELPRLVGVIRAIEQTGAFDQIVLDAGAGATTADVLAQFDVSSPVLTLDRRPELPEDLHGTLAETDCLAVVVHVDDHAGLCAAIAAARLGIAIVRVGGAPATRAGRVIARLSDLLLARSPLDSLEQPDAMARERTHVVGDPLGELIRQHARAALDAEAWRRQGVESGCYVLAVLTATGGCSTVARALGELSRSQPLVTVVPSGWDDLPGARVVQAPCFIERLSLERAARAIVTDSGRVQDEAAALGIPCHVLDGDFRPDAVTNTAGGEVPRAIALWDGRAGERAARALVTNFARVQLR